MAFNAPYVMAVDKREVVIQHKGGGNFNKFLRVEGDNVNPNGGQGAFARWEVELMPNDRVKLKSLKTGKYLRIKPNAAVRQSDKIDCGGAGGKWTVFKRYKKGQNNEFTLESAEQPGLFLSFTPQNEITIGKGGPWCNLRFFRQGGGGGGGNQGGGNKQPFSLAYVFKASGKEVVIQHKGGGQEFNKFLRVEGDNANPNGGKGAFARWEVELMDGGSKIKLKSKKTGKYLRIKPGAQRRSREHIDVGGGGGKWTVFKVNKKGQPNEVTLESAEQPGLFLAFTPQNDIQVGAGGGRCNLLFFRDN